MKIQQMQQIVEISVCKSINKAAQKLFLSQSALCASLNAAEAELGQKIMIRSHDGIRLTKFGEMFVESAVQILAIYNSLLQDGAAEPHQQLSISSQHIRFALSVFLDLCNESRDIPINFKFTEKSVGDVCKDVLEKASDIGLMFTPTTMRDSVVETLDMVNLTHHIVCTCEPCCIVGMNSPFYQQESDVVSLKQLSLYPRIIYEEPKWLWTKDIFKDERSYFPHSRYTTISDTGSFHELLKQTDSFFIGIRMESAYQKLEYYNNLRLLHILDAAFPSDLFWIHRKGETLSTMSTEFLSRIYQAMGKPVAGMFF